MQTLKRKNTSSKNNSVTLYIYEGEGSSTAYQPKTSEPGSSGTYSAGVPQGAPERKKQIKRAINHYKE
ncbi:MAG: hypothetical protein NC081_02095 [Roseburia sp.]|nr:hypothetical protein [Roseburia sp.]